MCSSTCIAGHRMAGFEKRRGCPWFLYAGARGFRRDVWRILGGKAPEKYSKGVFL